MNNLLDILKGCLYPNTFHEAESMLAQQSQKPTFLQNLLLLIPNQQPQILVMALSTLKNYILSRWNLSQQNNIIPISLDQKQLILDNIFNLYYEIRNNDQAVNQFRIILRNLILYDYPWPGLDQQLNKDLSKGFFASAHFFRQIAKIYEYSSDQIERKKADYFVNSYFPKIQLLVEQCIINFYVQTSKLLNILIKTFFSTIHIELPQYFFNQDKFIKWFIYIKAILNAPPFQNNILNQRIAAKTLSRIISKYLNQELDGNRFVGWSQRLRTKIAEGIIQTFSYCLKNSNGDQQKISHILMSIVSYCQNQKLRGYLNEKGVKFIIYEFLLPSMETNQDDFELLIKDPIQYIRKDEDLSNNRFKRCAVYTVEKLLNYCSFGQRSELMKFIQYTATSLQSSSVSNRHKEVLIRQLTKMSGTLKKKQILTNTYFLPLLKIDSPLLNAQICRLFAAYLDDIKLSEATINQLTSCIYQKMIGKQCILKYNAILAFTSLLSQQSTLNSAKGHFQNILQIYIKMLDKFDHYNLLTCLQRITIYFPNQIATHAPNLISYLLEKFFSLCNVQEKSDQNEQDVNEKAQYCLWVIKQILQCPLSDQIYYEASKQITPMLKQIFNELQHYFSDILSLINTLVYKSKKIIDFETVYVICRKLLEENNCQIDSNKLDYDVMELMNKIISNSDPEQQKNLISILKNLIQKLPDNILHKYPYPVHSELILTLIQNKRLGLSEIKQLNTSFVDGIWAQYLQSYKAIVYGQGNISNPQSLKPLSGVSLHPWLMNYCDVNLVKIILSQIQQQKEQNNDHLDEQNTMQLLEKYANEDDDEEAYDEYYGTQGVNYTFLYDSPFDSSKDRQLFKQKIKSLSNQDAICLMNMLNNKDKKRIQTLFN